MDTAATNLHPSPVGGRWRAAPDEGLGTTQTVRTKGAVPFLKTLIRRCAPPSPDGRRVIGELSATSDGVFVREEHRGAGEIVYIFVDETVRGTGAGQALLTHAETLTRTAGLTRMSLLVMSGNRIAVDFYKHCGFGTRAFKMLKKIG